MSVANVAQRRTLRPNHLAQKLSMAISTMWFKAKTDPEFPKPVKLSSRVTVFFEDEVDQYLVACANKSRSSAEA